jgi:peptidyl-prolyl cis-trans isomerase SurA
MEKIKTKYRNLWMLCLAMVLSLSALAQPQQTVEKIIATVGDEIILLSDLENSLNETYKGKTISQEQRCAAFETLLYQKLLLHHARVDSVEVTESDVNAQVERRIEYFVQMLGSEEAFEQYYGKSISLLKEDFFDMVMEQMLVEREQQEVTKGVVTTPADVLKYFKDQPKDSIPLIPEQIAFSKIEFSPKIKEREINRVIHFLDSLRADIAAGRSSMTLQAAKWSEDPGSRYKGGCYPLQRRGTFVPEYEAAVYNTDEGKFTPVFKSDFGYHFVKVVEKRGDFYESCHILMTPKVLDKDLDVAHALADSVHANIVQNKMDFKAAARQYSTDEDSKNQEGQVLSPSTGGLRHEIGSIQPEINLLLSQLQPGQMTAPVLNTTEDGAKSYVIYRLDERINAHRANMDLDYEIFQNAASTAAKSKATDQWVKSKLSRTYVQIDESLKGNCSFEFGWIEKK